jgi:hypothetical protein
VNKQQYYHFFVPIPPFIGNEKNNKKLFSNEINQNTQSSKTRQISLIECLLSSRIRTFWERIKWIICSKRIRRRQRKRLKVYLILIKNNFF